MYIYIHSIYVLKTASANMAAERLRQLISSGSYNMTWLACIGFIFGLYYDIHSFWQDIYSLSFEWFHFLTNNELLRKSPKISRPHCCRHNQPFHLIMGMIISFIKEREAVTVQQLLLWQWHRGSQDILVTMVWDFWVPWFLNRSYYSTTLMVTMVRSVLNVALKSCH